MTENIRSEIVELTEIILFGATAAPLELEFGAGEIPFAIAPPETVGIVGNGLPIDNIPIPGTPVDACNISFPTEFPGGPGGESGTGVCFTADKGGTAGKETTSGK